MADKKIGPKEAQLQAMRVSREEARQKLARDPASVAKLRESVAKVKPKRKKTGRIGKK